MLLQLMMKKRMDGALLINIIFMYLCILLMQNYYRAGGLTGSSLSIPNG
ncbi:hypothetical protein HanXRQr2_Chr14g0642141 [Helianthus annuus]|uniref:Uncharacterized protein n=1 Tax=Helianthus annuus TaxID=4232 RepID=A0A9K3E8M1_HELAN|nr:hypothetical protein HanXRQr2_Chr14g0642141 [Helianthus annuus]